MFFSKYKYCTFRVVAFSALKLHIKTVILGFNTGTVLYTKTSPACKRHGSKADPTTNPACKRHGSEADQHCIPTLCNP